MNISVIVKTYGLFAVIFCIAITMIAIVVITMPINGFFITTPYNSEKFLLFRVLLSIILLLGLMPQPIALFAYYFSGGIGKNIFAHILFGLLVVSFISLLLIILSVVSVYFTTEMQANEYSIDSVLLDNINIFAGIMGFLHFTVFPFAFSITALVVQKVALWKRFLPMISFVLTIAIAFILGIAIYAIGAITKIELIYLGIQDATLANWFMLGAVAWVVTALPAFMKDKNENNEVS